MLRKFLIPALFLLLPMGMLYPLWSCPTCAGEDDVVYYYPLRVMAAEQVRSRQLPLWNAGEAGGVALLADPQSAVFFPPNWMFLFLPPQLAYSLCIFGAFALAGGGAYLYMRRIGLTLPAAIFGAVAFEFCGFMVGHRVHLGIIQAAAFLPWGLWAVEKVRTGGRAGFAWSAPIFALTLAAGHWPTAVNLVVIWFIYLLIRGRPIKRALAASAAAAIVGSAVLAPQIIATVSYIQQTIRSGVPYAVAGENSFFPLAGILAFFPFIMGSRTPNFFTQQWWGPWHHCEMLGYVGLVTLTLAAGTVWRLYRKKKIPAERSPRTSEEATPTDCVPWVSDDIRRFVRLWTWILIGAGIWALGYYLPTYRLIHMIPILGSVRCPARMLLVINFALAVLAAAGISALAKGSAAGFSRTVRRAAMWFLPACMLLTLAVLMLAEIGEEKWWYLRWFLTIPPGVEAYGMMSAAMNLVSPAVYVPLALTAATIAAMLWVLHRPGRRAWFLTVLVIVDLFFIARFVDVPPMGQAASGQPCSDPQRSPAAAWLKANAPADEPFRLWGLSKSYHHRPAELLLPKTCTAMGFETISYYGPFQPADHAHLFGFRSWGENYEWVDLVRRNYLISLFNVRYILAAGPDFRRVIESVRIPAGPTPPDGPDVLGDVWVLHRAEHNGGVLKFQTRSMRLPSEAAQPITLEAGQVHRIVLDARAPAGAGNCIMAEFVPTTGVSPSWSGVNPAMLRVDVERLSPRWRHFEWSFRAQASSVAIKGVFHIRTSSNSPVEVRNVSLHRSSWPTPINIGGRLKPGEAVYKDLTPAGLKPTGPRRQRVHIYENRLCLPRQFSVDDYVFFSDNEQVIEALRWDVEKFDLMQHVLVVWCDKIPLPRMFTSESRRSLDSAWSIQANGMGTADFRKKDLRRGGSSISNTAAN